jgi:hypothetical protein
MRIVSWNCRQGFDSKTGALLRLAPDLAILPESHQRPAIAGESLFGNPVPHLWTGLLPSKGLGVLAPGATSLEMLPPENDRAGNHGIAGRARHGSDETTVVGVWTVPLASVGDPYLAAAYGIVEKYATALASGNAIMAGDFNVSGRTCLAGVTAFFREVRERFGLVSAYHAFHRVEVGGEPAGTLWWRGDERAAFHCDFVFVPAAWTITNVELGSYEAWGSSSAQARSDHAPVIVDVAR